MPARSPPSWKSSASTSATAPRIEEADVRASVRDLAESWIFDFTKALAQRQAGAGAGAAARPVRAGRASAAPAGGDRARAAAAAAGARLPGRLAGQRRGRRARRTRSFATACCRTLGESEREALGGLHPYVLYQCLQNASRTTRRRPAARHPRPAGARRRVQEHRGRSRACGSRHSCSTCAAACGT